MGLGLTFTLACLACEFIVLGSWGLGCGGGEWGGRCTPSLGASWSKGPRGEEECRDHTIIPRHSHHPISLLHLRVPHLGAEFRDIVSLPLCVRFVCILIAIATDLFLFWLKSTAKVILIRMVAEPGSPHGSDCLASTQCQARMGAEGQGEEEEGRDQQTPLLPRTLRSGKEMYWDD